MRVLVRFLGLDRDESLYAYAERGASFALGRLASPGDLVIIRLTDVNGPKGGDDKVCTMSIRSRTGTDIVVAMHASPYAAIDRACERLAHTVRRRREKRQTRVLRPPIRRGASGKAVWSGGSPKDDGRLG